MPDNDLFRLEKPKSGKISVDSRRSWFLPDVAVAVLLDDIGLAEEVDGGDAKPGELVRAGTLFEKRGFAKDNGELLPSLLFTGPPRACMFGDRRDPAGMLAACS